MERTYVLIAVDKDSEILSVSQDIEVLQNLVWELKGSEWIRTFPQTDLVIQTWENGDRVKEEVVCWGTDKRLYVNLWFPLRWIPWGMLYTLLAYSIYLAFW